MPLPTKHHRLIFWVLIVLMIASFIIFTSPGESPFSCRPSNTFGTVFGDGVTQSRLVGQMQFNDMMKAQGPNQGQEQRISNAYYNLVMQEAARRSGITVSEYEVAEVVNSLPLFHNDKGVFDYEQYRAILKRAGMTPDEFERRLEGELLANKFTMTLMSGAGYADGEVQAFLDYLNEKFNVRMAFFSYFDFTDGIEVSDEELQSFFARHAGEFRIPPQLTAVAVRVDFNDEALVKAAEAQLTDEMVRAYIDNNPSQFNLTGEIDYAKAEPVARELVIKNLATKQATEELTAFFKEVGPLVALIDPGKPEERRKVFEELAREHGLEIVDTGTFTEGGMNTGAIADPEIGRQVARRTSSSPLTGAVRGRDGMYVAMLLTHQPERDATFEEKAEEVRKAYLAEAATRLAREAAVDAHLTLSALPAEEFVAALEASENKFGDAMEIERQRFLAMPYGAQLTAMRPGELSEVLDTRDGAMMIYVVERKPGDPATSEQARDMAGRMLQQNKMNNMDMLFNEYIFANGCVPPNLGLQE